MNRQAIAELRQRTAPPSFYDATERPFDAFINLTPEALEIANEVLAPSLETGRKRRLHKRHVDRCRLVLGCVLANAVLARQSGVKVHYSRGLRTYSGKSPYCPEWLGSKQLLRVVDQLISNRQLAGTTAAKGGQPNMRQSTFELTSEGADLLHARGIGVDCIVANERLRPVVIVRDRQGRLCTYPEEATREQVDALRRYNEFLSQRIIEVEDVAIEQQEERLVRIFNGGSLELGGRLFGGWWQNVPREHRRKVTIDGEATIELDFRSFSGRALYHQRGLSCEIDPYDVPSLTQRFREAGTCAKDARTLTKAVFQLILNAKGPQGLHGSEVARSLPETISVYRVVDGLKERNPAIADAFFSGASLSLMKLESDICLGVISAGVEVGILVLPIHDSFIVQARHADWLSATMKETYRSRTGGYDPIIG